MDETTSLVEKRTATEQRDGTAELIASCGVEIDEWCVRSSDGNLQPEDEDLTSEDGDAGEDDEADDCFL